MATRNFQARLLAVTRRLGMIFGCIAGVQKDQLGRDPAWGVMGSF